MHGPPTACRHTVSGSISLPSQGFFSPFPHGTGSLSVAREYLALESGLPRFPPDYTCPVVLRMPLRVRSAFGYMALTFFGSAFQRIHLAVELVTLLTRSYNPQSASTWVWAVPISLAATFGPHSDILGSKPACGSPRLIAACHVLLRLLAPRHSPYALSSLIIKLTQTDDPMRVVIPRSIATRDLSEELSLRDFLASKIRVSIFPAFRSLATQAFDSAVFRSQQNPRLAIRSSNLESPTSNLCL